MRKTHVLSLLITAALCVTAAGAYAKGGGGGAGGSSAGHISAQGLSNSNGHDSLDRDKGHARATDRASMHASKHKSHAGKTK